MRKIHIKNVLCALVLLSFFLCALANFWRNRDPYRAYFYRRSDRYLSTHVLEAGWGGGWDELALRLSRHVPSDPFYRAFEMLYKGGNVQMLSALELDHGRLTSGVHVVSNAPPSDFMPPDANLLSSLLQKARYGFLYSPVSFRSSSGQSLPDTGRPLLPCDPTEYPLFLVLVPCDDSGVNVVFGLRSGKYFFFLPAQYLSRFTKKAI